MRRTSSRARVAVAAAIVVVCLAVAAWLLDVGSRGSHGTQPIAAQGAGLSPPAGYRLVWADEFNGPRGSTPDPANWQFETGGNGWGNRELQYYTSRPSNASLDGAGYLAITARREVYTGSDGVTRNYTSALIQTAGRFETTYGWIQARIKLPSGAGLWPAFWAIGADFNRVGWPASGEIDLMENIASDPFKVYGTLHGPAPGRANGYNLVAAARSARSLAAAFHVFGIDWSPGKIVFTLDGVPYATRTPASLPAGGQWVFDKPFYLILNLAVGGNFPGPPDATTHFPAKMLVDWVRVYSK
jgi:beta-glucanase (GH16 family)